MGGYRIKQLKRLIKHRFQSPWR